MLAHVWLGLGGHPDATTAGIEAWIEQLDEDPAKSNRAAFSNAISSANVTSIAMELPIDCVTGSAKAGAAADAGKIIGGWTTASMRQPGRVL